jgi:hypothetical protein
MNTRILTLVLTALCSGTAIATTPAAPPAGEQWEYTQAMEMNGMKMPMPPVKICIPPGRDVTPPVDKSCQLSDVKTVGEHTTWKMRCSGADPMEGSGDFTRHGDQITGTIRTRSKAGEMTMNSTGRKLGACTPAQAAKAAP